MNKKLTYIFTLALLIINGMAMAQQQAHVTIGGSVFGGGNLAAVGGNTRVLIGKADNNVSNDTIKGDVYGGGALADVGTNNDNDSTTVTIFKGVVLGDVYGGGLGDSLVFKVDGSDTTYHTLYHGDTCIAALVHNKVYVNIGGVAATDTIGNATIKGSVFGCNNINGTPLDSVFVNIYKTAHTTGDLNNKYPNNINTLAALEGTFPQDAVDSTNYPKRFAITAVYGGGNKASYKPEMNAASVSNPATPKCTTVHVFDCTENTIQTIYGGGNAANVGDTTASGDTIAANTRLIVEGGRYDQVFGGGNGFSSTGNHDNAYAANYNPGANIFGTAVTEVQGGLYRQVFGGSNQYGDIDSVALCIDNQCEVLLIHESFGGANEADITSNISTTLLCNDYSIGSFYGGSNKADINGDVTLNVRGGNYTNVFGGSKGTKTTSTDPDEIALASADINGNVTLNLHGGTMVNAFGGSDVFGSISGFITVNVWDTVSGCPLQVDTIYGGGQDAAYEPDLVAGKKIVSPLVNLWKGTVGHGTVKGCVFGGGKGAGATVTAHPKVVIGDTIAGHSGYSITVLNGNVFGGGNAATVNGIDSVLMLKANSVVSNLFGGGNAADADTAVVMMTVAASVDTIFGGGNLAGLSGTAEVTVSNGTVKGGIYGGSNADGTVAKEIVVNVLGGTVGADGAPANIHGGGYGADTRTNGHVTVNYGNNPTTHSDFPKVYGDIYGGSALGEVNAGNDTTMINVLNGTVYGDIYGGGLGDNSNPAKVNGKVYVNIGKLEGITLQGEAAFSDTTMVFGCNNANGSPQDSVFVNIYHTAHTTTPNNTYPSQPAGGWTVADLATNSANQQYAIQAVYGGGNEAAYTPALSGSDPRSATVHVYGCRNNTIKEIYGGGNAANVGVAGNGAKANTFIIIDGGRINRVFGGGKGDKSADVAADIYGTATTTIKAGLIDTIFGGSNMNGSIDSISLMLAYVETCPGQTDEIFNQVYGGANEAGLTGNLSTTIKCGVKDIGDIYGGSNLANIDGSVTLNIRGGKYNTVFGGSKGAPGDGHGADITGDVELNLNGGTMVNAFGGSNVQGNIGGLITVNVLDTVTGCGLVVDTIYGAGQDAAYTPTIAATQPSPVVNLLKGTVGESTPAVAGCVFGGGKGSDAVVTGNPKVVIGDMATGHENYQVEVLGNVFGGGNAAQVDGIDTILMQKSGTYGSRVVNLFGGGNKATAGSTEIVMTGGAADTIFGGGNLAGLAGTARINMNGGTANKGIYGGCNAEGTVDGMITVEVNGGQVGASGARANVHGGGYGSQTMTNDSVMVVIGNGAGTPAIYGDVYGGSALGTINSKTGTINTIDSTFVVIKRGEVYGDVYGGGLGNASNEAWVYSPVRVSVIGGSVTGSVYGCNNVNGAPQSSVNVDIYGTDPASGSSFALGNVFGGGNRAAYTYGNGYPKVTVHNCNNSIEYVYGGGNAAKVASTDVKIYGGNKIGYVFGGGNGEGVAANFEMVSGNAVTNIYGGTIDHVFAGNNTSGLITGNITVNVDKSTAAGACDMKVQEVYGGGNRAAGKAGTIKIGCTGSLTADHYAHPERIGTTLEGIGTVYGGSNAANVSNSVELNINDGIINKVFGGNNDKDTIQGTITVNIEKTGSCDWYVGEVYGGGNHAPYGGTPAVNIIAGTIYRNVYGGGNDITADTLVNTPRGVNGSNVVMTGGNVLGGVYGGCKEKGSVATDALVSIQGGTIGSESQLTHDTIANVFGGGLGANTKVAGNVTVNFGNKPTAPGAPNANLKLYGDIYGGSALGSVNTGGSKTTTVNVLDGTLFSKTDTLDILVSGVPTGRKYVLYTGGNVFGGGLGEEGVSTKGLVYGKIEVNIGAPNNTRGLDPVNDTCVGNATIGGSVYGCNNTGGSPQDDVEVNIYRTYRRDKDQITYIDEDATYAIANVFGGGNKANYTATDKTATVNIASCYNTIRRVFGGSNAAEAPHVTTKIQGGRFAEVFGGGNGEVQAANITGNVNLEIHGGIVGEFFVGSNQNGTISGISNVTVDQTSGCEEVSITEFYCGGKYADFEGDINATITCSQGMHVDYLYGGCKEAHVVPKGTPGTSDYEPGNVTLTVKGGTFKHIFGGSKGTSSKGADIAGDVTLNIYGGTVSEDIFGGSNVKGAIGGSITVNVEQKSGADYCPLDVSLADVYGGGNKADYPGAPSEGSPITAPNTLPSQYNYPQVNIKNATVKNVFGGGLKAEVTGNPQVHIKKGSKILGNVYGGGNMGEVNGNPKVIINGKQTN